jgi:virginiamycin B lyase
VSRNGVRVGMRAALAAGALLLAAPGAASAVTIKEFNLPGTLDQAAATAITSAGGALWAAAPGGIYRINPLDGSAALIGDGANVPFAITTGPDGRAWFGEQDDDGNGAVGAVNLDNTINRFPDDVSDQPVIEDIAPGFPPSRFLWFTEQGDDIIGRIDTRDDSVDEFQTLLDGSGSVQGITAGPDGGIWFTESEDPGNIARLDPSSPIDDPHVDEFGTANGLTPDSAPGDIIVGPDGALWFAQQNGIGSISPVSGAISEHALPADVQPEQLVVGPDSAIWFTDENGQIGRLDPISGNVQEFGDDDTAGGAPEGITVGPDGAIWFTLPDSGQIGRLDLTTATPSPTPTPTATPTPTPTPSATPTPTPTPAGDTTAPVVSGLALSARCVRTGSGMTARFKLSENAHVLYSIRHRVGSPVRRRCPATRPHRHGPAGSSVQVGLKTADGQAGDNVATLARVHRGRSAVARARRGRNRARLARLVRGLRPGTYQLVVRATDAAGNVSRDRIVRFWVLRR